VRLALQGTVNPCCSPAQWRAFSVCCRPTLVSSPALNHRLHPATHPQPGTQRDTRPQQRSHPTGPGQPTFFLLGHCTPWQGTRWMSGTVAPRLPFKRRCACLTARAAKTHMQPLPADTAADGLCVHLSRATAGPHTCKYSEVLPQQKVSALRMCVCARGTSSWLCADAHSPAASD
jgi:hypothetical protein